MYNDIPRPFKHYAQARLSEVLVKTMPSNYYPDIVLGLCGPSPAEACETYNPELYREIILAENNPETYGKVKKLFIPNCQIHFGDILTCAYALKRHITGIDFDFCQTLDSKLAGMIKTTVCIIANAHRRPFWIRIASSLRGIGIKQTKENICLIREALLAIGRDLHVEYEYRYSDQGAMYIYQAWVTYGDYMPKVAKSTQEREQTMPERTLKQLSDAEAEMVRILADNMRRGITYEDIRKQFNLTKMSLAAIKAWKTMRG